MIVCSELDILIKYLEIVLFLSGVIYVSIQSVIAAIDLKKRFPSETTKIINALWIYIPEVIDYLEQMRKRDDVDKSSLRALGEAKIQELLKQNGIDIDISVWSNYIEVLVESAVSKLPKFKIDSDK